LPTEEAKDIKELLQYPENTAGSIMTNAFLSIPEDLKVADALTLFRTQKPPDSEVAFYMYVVNTQHQLVGYISLRNLLLAPPTATIKSIRNDYPIHAHVLMDQEDIAKLIQKYDLITLPIIDDHNKLVGLITIDDVVDVVVEEATEDLYKLSGTSDSTEHDLISGKLTHSLLARSPWLCITILGGIISAYLITTFSKQFTDTHFTLALSLSFIPLLMGFGGNIGNQSATIIVRGISTGTVNVLKPFQYIFRETLIGLIMGSTWGIVLLLGSYYLMHHSLLFSSIIAISLLCNITSAAVIGASLPLLLKKGNIDPAIASAPLISSTLDILGQIIYFILTLKIIQHFL
jgi:magnesium transporter